MGIERSVSIPVGENPSVPEGAASPAGPRLPAHSYRSYPDNVSSSKSRRLAAEVTAGRIISAGWAGSPTAKDAHVLEAPYPELDDLLEMMGEAGQRLSDIDASEGAAGNISICLRWPLELRNRFPLVESIELPRAVPELAGATFLVSGSGRRLREIIDEPTASLACVVVDAGGQTGTLHQAYQRRFQRVTSEFNSHLAVHYDQVLASGTNFHALIHAQPPYLTYLSHVPRYQDEVYLNHHLLRWQPETIVQLPEGIGFIPFKLPGSAQLMAANVAALRAHRIVVWAKHGVMARSDVSVKRSADRVEYAETGARYEYLNLMAGGEGEGLSADELRAICEAFGVKQAIF